MSEDGRMNDTRTHWPQIIGSILVAVAIVAITIAIVTAKFGPTPSAEIDAQEDRLELQEDLADERRDAAEERRENAAE